MKRLLLLATLLLVAAAAVLLTSSPASALECGGSGDVDDGGGSASAYCSTRHPGYPPADPEALWNKYCYTYMNDSGVIHPYEPGATVDIIFLQNATPEQVASFGYNPTGEYGILRAICNEAGGGGDIGGDYIFTITPPVPVTDLRDDAKARIDIPNPRIGSNPPFGEELAIVHIDTWLWVEEGYWQTQNESEESGFVRVDVFARPDKTTWTFSNGDTAVCQGTPGVPWTPGATTTDCFHRFTSSSANGGDDAYSAEATVTWIFSWAINGTPQGDFGEPFLATTIFAIQVGEIQAIES